MISFWSLMTQIDKFIKIALLPAVQCLSTARLGGACVVDNSLTGVVQGNHSIVILCVLLMSLL